MPLTPKAAALLECLLVHRGEWVSKATILADVWPDTHVQPENIKVLVREIRQALEDSTHDPRYVASAHGLGYSFVAPVTESPADAESDLPAARSSAFVGRERELGVLEHAWKAATSEAPLPQLVLIAGEQGVGKTALCESYLENATSAGAVQVCLSQCIDNELGREPYYPILDALIRLDRRSPGYLPALLERHAPAWHVLVPHWSTGRRPSRSSGDMRRELLAALDELSRTAPVVLVIEDLQWADAPTLGALAAIARSRSRSRLLTIGTYRIGEWSAGAQARARMLAAWSGATTISLGPLTPEHVLVHLSARRDESALAPLAPLVHSATGGNAALVRAVLDGLNARRLVSGGAGSWQAVAPLDVIARELPNVITEIINRELDRLDPQEEAVIEAAAAVGFEFTPAAVAFALETNADEVRAVLHSLARRAQVVALVSSPEAGGSPAAHFRFRHALFVNVVSDRAPRLRQLRFLERLAALREPQRRRA